MSGIKAATPVDRDADPAEERESAVVDQENVKCDERNDIELYPAKEGDKRYPKLQDGDVVLMSL